MERTYSFFQFRKAKLHYAKSGNGDKVLLFFHGFGLTHELFYPIEEYLKGEYTIYNFDIFFHGKSEWNYADQPISIDFWKEMLNDFLEQNKIEKFSMLGFSIGAKHVLAALAYYPSRIEKLILIAPDGIRTSVWYTLSIHSWLSRIIFKQLVMKPGYFNSFVKVIHFFGFAPKESIRFAATQLGTEEQRRRVYHTWIAYRKLKISKGKIIKLINQYQIPTEIYLGKHDRIVPYLKLKSFLEQLPNVRIELLEAGHSNLMNVVAKRFEEKHRQ